MLPCGSRQHVHGFNGRLSLWNNCCQCCALVGRKEMILQVSTNVMMGARDGGMPGSYFKRSIIREMLTCSCKNSRLNMNSKWTNIHVSLFVLEVQLKVNILHCIWHHTVWDMIITWPILRWSLYSQAFHAIFQGIRPWCVTNPCHGEHIMSLCVQP